MDIAAELLAGSRLALTRAITAVENEYDNAVDIMRRIYPHTGKAFVIGITGPPGAGKSTLTDKLAKEYRRMEKTVGIIAVDPTSPFTGGAILGDRIRMNELSVDPGVFIRSMATRGGLGGLSHKTAEAVKLMDAFGKDIIIIETVGVGQSEVDIVKAADSTLVVLIPGMGDDIQAIKAGILEIGDLFVINKADRDGVDRLNIEIEAMLDFNSQLAGWRPPVRRVVATQNQGITELVLGIEEHKAYLENNGNLIKRRAQRTENEVLAMLNNEIGRSVRRKLNETGQFAQMIADIQLRKTDPYSVVTDILKSMLR